MTVEEIFKKIATHMVEGLMFHDHMGDYYMFLGLNGYSRCHEYHFFEENAAYHSIKHFYMKKYRKFLTEDKPTEPQVIPATWRQYAIEQVDINTKRNGIKTGIESWVKWETDTQKLYEELYRQLITINEIEASMYVKKLIVDVSNELEYAHYKHIYLKSIDYDLVAIMEAQEKTEKECNKKIEKLEL